MYGRCSSNISRALRPLFIKVLRDLQEILPYFDEILCKYKTAYNSDAFCIFILRKQKECLLSVVPVSVIPPFQYLERSEGGIPLPPKEALERVIESPRTNRSLDSCYIYSIVYATTIVDVHRHRLLKNLSKSLRLSKKISIFATWNRGRNLDPLMHKLIISHFTERPEKSIWNSTINSGGVRNGFSSLKSCAHALACRILIQRQGFHFSGLPLGKVQEWARHSYAPYLLNI